MSAEIKIYQIFEKHYGSEDAYEIVQSLKGIIEGDQQCDERLINTFVKNKWSQEDAQSFVDALKDSAIE